MRIAGEDEGIDAELAVLAIRAATVSGSPTSAVPAPPRTRPTPAHRFGLISSLSRRPPCSAVMRCWPTESMRAKTFWAAAIVSSSTCWISSSAACQASALVSRTITCSRMPNVTLAAARGRDAPYRGRSSRRPAPAARPRSGTCRPSRPRPRCRRRTSRRNRAADAAAAPAGTAAAPSSMRMCLPSMLTVFAGEQRL